MAAGGAAGGAAAAAAAVNALKASGAIVRLEPAEFEKILNLAEAPLVVTASGGLFGRSHQYLTSYKGLAFFTKSSEPIHLPGTAVVVAAKTIWIPA
jgi:hypothetical protein